MRVLLRNLETGQYFVAAGVWTNSPGQATDFVNTASAIHRVYELKLREMEVVMCFEDPRYNIRLQVRGPGK